MEVTGEGFKSSFGVPNLYPEPGNFSGGSRGVPLLRAEPV